MLYQVSISIEDEFVDTYEASSIQDAIDVAKAQVLHYVHTTPESLILFVTEVRVVDEEENS